MSDGDIADARRPSRRDATRTAIILAAERIFSEEGLSNTPLRRITQAAGQRNESAIHYHFGSREGLVAAILELRTTPINRARVEILMRMRAEAAGAPLTSRDVAAALSRPLHEYLRESGGRSSYLRFLGMLWLDRPMWRQFERRAQDEGLIIGLEALLEAKPHLPADLVRHRYGLAIQMSTYALARMERFASDRGEAFDWLRAEADLSDLIDAIAAIFDAPISSETVQALRAREAGRGD